MKKTIFFLGIIFYLLLLIQTASAASWPAGAGVNIGTKLDAGYEPSGIIWHNRLQSLFVVWDNGYITQLDVNGNILHPTTYVGGDLEGITVADEESDYIYLLVEYPQQIVEFDISTWKKTGKTWKLQGMVGNSASGAEALTYNGEKGLFYVGSQYDGQIYVYNINLSSSGSPNYPYKIATGISFDSSGIYYLKETKTTYAVFDSSDKIQEYNNDNKLAVQYTIPGVDQEGVALLSDCAKNTATIFIAQDSGAVMKYNNYPISCSITPPPPVDQDKDGYPVGQDCNDNDASVHANQTYYRDNDQDGLGDPENSTSVCSLSFPVGYVGNSNDLNDNDHDNDGVVAGTDCNDDNAGILGPQIYYHDADKDGFGNPAKSTLSCALPAGYVSNANDKNDNDYDNDGSEIGVDCNDEDGTVWEKKIYYKDADGDGVGTGAAESICSAVVPSGYTSDSVIDCNDNDKTISANQIYYLDKDNDGLGDPENSTSVCSLSFPVGYVGNSNDLNDNDHDNDGVVAGTDCNDDNAGILGPQIYYHDADKDGFGNPAKSTLSCALPAGYVSNANDKNDNDYDNDGSEIGVDCNDNDPAIHANQTYYRDADGDGFGDPANYVSVCSSQPPSGYVSNANDDNDNPAPPPAPSLSVKLEGKYIYVNDQKIKIFWFTPVKAAYKALDLDGDGLTEIVVVGVHQFGKYKIFVPVVLQVDKKGSASIINVKKLDYAKYMVLWKAGWKAALELEKSL